MDLGWWIKCLSITCPYQTQVQWCTSVVTELDGKGDRWTPGPLWPVTLVEKAGTGSVR